METPNSLRYLHLPQELTEEILSRLAVKSLLRFRCVSKSWRSLIDSERFIKTHLQNSSRNTAFSHHRLISILKNSKKLFDDEMSSWSESVRMVGCCNGLVCCCINLKKGRFLLWNPATRISKELPQLIIENGDFPYPIYGFGWDESSGAYKVFVIFCNGRKFMGKVYSSNTNSWKTVEFCDFRWIYGNAQFVSGKLHWVSKNNDEMNVFEIVTFDLKEEEFGVMKLPCDQASVLRLGVNEGRLTMICSKKIMKHAIDVWVMKQDCWVKVMDVVVYDPCEILPSVAPFCAVYDAEIRLVRGSNFKVYDQARDDMRLQIKKIRASLQAHLYIESLVSPVPDKNLCRAI
ncbi:F-box/kelch-repeat protein At3g23880-like [Salvia miltiorrhiza]|uniref:F-box/kelch-repeat protein At3g23880-like n=1 Tax=Salvia miltiorrhiza TaxID=226208 RepID=UPI0025ACF063|nr:F-box/kelch-repeat protein At3g23880-like [Salvia miltiorrhiza]